MLGRGHGNGTEYATNGGWGGGQSRTGITGLGVSVDGVVSRQSPEKRRGPSAILRQILVAVFMFDDRAFAIQDLIHIVKSVRASIFYLYS